MIEIRGTLKSVKDEMDIVHGITKEDRVVVCFFLEDEYKRNYEKPIDKLWHKITKRSYSK
jgi:hypothetical protein